MLSARTINLMLMSLKEVFKALEYDAGIEETPFNIDKMASERQTREAFTKEELKEIVVDGRSRKLSIKDVHSLRHTFCYLAGLQNIPLLIVKAVVGHMSGEMTALYQRHSDMKAKRAELSKMPDFLSVGQYEPKLIVDPGQGGDLKENIRRILSDGKLTAREKKILKLAKG